MGMDREFHTAKSVHLKETLNQQSLCIEGKKEMKSMLGFVFANKMKKKKVFACLPWKNEVTSPQWQILSSILIRTRIHESRASLNGS